MLWMAIIEDVFWELQSRRRQRILIRSLTICLRFMLTINLRFIILEGYRVLVTCLDFHLDFYSLSLTGLWTRVLATLLSSIFQCTRDHRF